MGNHMVMRIRWDKRKPPEGWELIKDAALILQWRKPGYEILCSMLSIEKNAQNFSTTSLCRVPLKQRPEHMKTKPSVKTGCISCCSGDGKNGGPLWWNFLSAKTK